MIENIQSLDFKRNGVRTLKKILLSLLILFISTTSARAVDNVLQTVQIDGLKDTYNIILKSDNEPKVKKVIKASNRMILELKGIKASATINTIYNNTTGVDSVMVEPFGEEGLKVFIQADNVENAIVTLDTLNSPLSLKDKKPQVDKKSAINVLSELKTQANEVQETLSKTKEEKSSIVLNRPIRDYEQIYDETGLDEEESEFLGGSFIETLKNVIQDENVSNIVTIGLIAIIFLCGVKLFRKKDDVAQIGLTGRLRDEDRKMDMYRELSQREASIGPMSNPQESVMPNMMLNQFMPMQQQVQNVAQKPQVNRNIAPNMGYGIKAYQQSVKNPYVTSDIKQRQSISSATETLGRDTTVSRAATATMASRRNVKNMSSTTATPSRTATNVDSMKFLESMAKIYEKNGRMDLAKSLKAGMTKAKTR